MKIKTLVMQNESISISNCAAARHAVAAEAQQIITWGHQWTGRVVPIFSRRIRLLLTIHSNFQVCLHVIRGFVKKNSKILAPYPLGGAVFGRHFFLSIFSTLEVWKAPFFAGYDPKMISHTQFRFLRFTKSCRIRKSSFPVAVADRTNLVLRVQILQFWRFRLRLIPFFSP